MLVLVDSTVEGALTASLAEALDDLRGDGWLPVDGYYGDVNGTWTPSTSINVTTLQGTRTMAPPNDARFSPDTIPSPLELAVGRVDMLNLPLIAAGTETQLLTACFTKLHAWKTASTTATRRASLRNGLEGAGISTAGSWAELSAIVGATAVTADTSNTVRLSQLVNGESYLWTVGHYFGEGVTGAGAAAVELRAEPACRRGLSGRRQGPSRGPAPSRPRPRPRCRVWLSMRSVFLDRVLARDDIKHLDCSSMP